MGKGTTGDGAYGSVAGGDRPSSLSAVALQPNELKDHKTFNTGG